MTGPQEQETRFNSRPLWVLLFFVTALVIGMFGLFTEDWDKVVIGLLFVAVGNLTRTIGVYRQQLGLFP